MLIREMKPYCLCLFRIVIIFGQISDYLMEECMLVKQFKQTGNGADE